MQTNAHIWWKSDKGESNVDRLSRHSSLKASHLNNCSYKSTAFSTLLFRKEIIPAKMETVSQSIGGQLEREFLDSFNFDHLYLDLGRAVTPGCDPPVAKSVPSSPIPDIGTLVGTLNVATADSTCCMPPTGDDNTRSWPQTYCQRDWGAGDRNNRGMDCYASTEIHSSPFSDGFFSNKATTSPSYQNSTSDVNRQTETHGDASSSSSCSDEYRLVMATGVEDAQLLHLSVKDLNKRLIGKPREEVMRIKKKRRTLKNRGYAQSCRSKRAQIWSTLEEKISQLEDRLISSEKKNQQLIQERDYYYSQWRRCSAKPQTSFPCSITERPCNSPAIYKTTAAMTVPSASFIV
ncbi:PREDICTED: uncharacterized protein LOC106812519 [Priapulus caudatus]|uniref:Uncharacterized protein LOC106812519 n=1 Tax=Priapulus caudatus TaxID=37621 RepID=A0ABM1EI79_PRICU|nr:PREDICTED: uncharacterized protein LOC106812519 [Priapulus caudatus]